MVSKTQKNYDYIKDKIKAMKEQSYSLRDKSDDFVFNALTVKSMFYKNPSFEITESDFDDIIVDGHSDGGVDILLSDPSSETSDLIIGQGKFYQKISFDDCSDAINKMIDFYVSMNKGHYENANAKVQQRFLVLDAEVGEESTIKFVLFTSSPKNKIRLDRLEKIFYGKLQDRRKFELIVMFDEDIIDEIKEAESRRPSVSRGEIDIDVANNWLKYEDKAAIVNVSALSIKKLFALHHTTLLAKNLRYHVSGASVDRAIEGSINNNPEWFWLKNNGITIICDKFDLDGKVVKLTNFSIVNGGQTTYKIAKNKKISEDYNFYLPCKIVKIIGDNEDEKGDFTLEIAKATNSQKAIKNSDLKANAPEQIRFSQAMRDVGIFYQTKRGETIPKVYKPRELHTNISEIGKLCLSAVFQMPCSSRNKPSKIYSPEYYEYIFNGNQSQMAKICKELLYIDCYFRTIFIKKYVKDIAKSPGSEIKVQFANNSRTVCTAFVMIASRFYQQNLTPSNLEQLFEAGRKDKLSDVDIYNMIKNINNITWILPLEIIEDKDKYDEVLDKLFTLIIKHGSHDLKMNMKHEDTLTASNYLKKDKNYIEILDMNWDSISEGIENIFGDL